MLEAQLHNDLDEAQQMERKIVEISGLLDVFTEKVVDQHSTIEQIRDNAETTKVNVTKGNEQLVKAREYGSGFGFMIFVCLVPWSLCCLCNRGVGRFSCKFWQCWRTFQFPCTGN